jgi:NitT/TauT family transport system ATP-binding protein
MRQRVSIARALTLEPPLLLMDEPFAALDQITRHRMNFELLRIWSTTDSTVLFVTHNIREAVLLSDRVFVFRSQPGRIMEIIDINLPRPRYLELTDTSEFNDLHVLGERFLEEAIHEVIEN